MATTQATGNDGSVTLPSGTHDAVARAWQASFPRVVTDVTGFSNTYQRNRLGLMSVTGSVTCIPKYDAANHSPGVLDRVAGGSALTLQVATGCTYALTAVFGNISFTSDKQGDAGLTYEFANGDSDTITETWDET